MKIVSWNCRGGFRKKIEEIIFLNADIYIIQESENPDNYPKLKNRIKTYFYIGENDKHKGVLIFTLNENIALKHAGWEDFYRRFFIPVVVNNSFIVVGLWACNPYIHELYFYLRLIKRYFTDMPIVFMGDTNSNKQFDHKHNREGNHSDTIRLLNSWGYESMYHYFSGEEQGKETVPTFRMHNHKDKPYHIDFCFAKPKFVKHFEIITEKKFETYSDHNPLSIELTDDL
ncbi:MAG: hypothetical protein IKD33_03620 [Bacteroidales bacterium]|nr:hypothetical protein [Bacteroidales bacterium]